MNDPRPGADGSHWRRLDRLFEGALEQPPDQRRGFLARAAEDSGLMSEAAALVEAHAAAEGFLAAPVWSAAASAEERTGQRLGPWRIERLLGRGGMGAVYLAHRDDDAYRGRAAIKTLAPLVHGPAIERRFRAEQNILARLEHPHIARLLDAGRDADGALYFVMEYVEGEPIDQACDRRRLSVEERLELFRTVCDAVQYAHRNLVVHRDLKPANILITRDGRPKLLDFGIAKLLAPDPGLVHEPTRTGLTPLTPNHASPEQLRGQLITTGTDVYALGVLLFQLLTGRLPRRFESLELREIERRLAAPPPPPSLAALDGEPAAVEARAVHRRLTPKALRRRLSGDLDHIVAKSLRDEPERRYASAERLGDDVGRHLGGEPVEARRGAWGYRAGKLLRRHRMPVSAFLLFLILVTGFLFLEAAQSRVLERERDQARQVADYLTHLLGDGDLWENEGRGTTVRQLLERGSSEILGEIETRPQPVLVLTALASANLRAGLAESAAELLAAALLQHRRHTPEGPRGDLERAEIYSLLARARSAVGDYARAEELHRAAWELRRRHLEPDHPSLGESLHQLAGTLLYLGRYEAAEESFGAALHILRSHHDTDPVALGELLTEYAILLGRRSRFLRANEFLDQAEKRLRSVLDPGDPRLLTIRLRRGVHHLHLFELGVAERMIREVFESRQRRLGAEHPETLEAQYHLGAVWREQGRFDESEALLRRALETGRRVFHQDHVVLGDTLGHLAGTLAARGDPEGAEETFRESRAVLEGSASPTPDAAIVLMYEGRMVHLQNRPQEAEPLLRQARGELAVILPPGQWQVATADVFLGSCLLDLGRLNEARYHLDQGLQALERGRARYLRPLCNALDEMARLHQCEGDETAARRYRLEAADCRAETSVRSLDPVL